MSKNKIDNENINGGNNIINIINDTECMIIKIDKNGINQINTDDILKLIKMSLLDNIQPTPKLYKRDKSKNKIIRHVAFFIDMMQHYTGGRYSIYQQAVLLSNYVKVTVVSNRSPLFKNDFKEYINENFSLIISSDMLFNETDNDFDLIVGMPVIGGIHAKEYANKFDLPLWLILFESPNWIQLYRDGVDAVEEFWKSYKMIMENHADKVLVPSNESKKYLLEWIDTDVSVDVIYPCINEIVAESILFDNKYKTKNDKKIVLMTSRLVSFKNPLGIIKKLSKEYKYILIGKIWDNAKLAISKLIHNGYDITILESITDELKFRWIKKASIIIHPSIFEGFGMPPMEAMYFNKPVIAYDLPVLNEIYDNNIIYAELGDEKDFANKVEENINKKIKYDKTDLYSIKRCANDLINVFNIPKITAGIIVHNGTDYINYAIKSIYNYVNQIIIIHGKVELYPDKDEYDTFEQLLKLKDEIDYLNKINLVTKKSWSDKIEMQNEIAKRVTGDYYLKLDHDEIWKPETLLDAIQYMNDNNADIIKMPFLHFWTNFHTIAKDAGGKWSTCHPRIWKWQDGFHHTKSFNYFVDKNNAKVSHSRYKDVTFLDNEFVYHFGYVRALADVQNKIDYYGSRKIEQYAIDTYTNWSKLSDRTQPTQNVKSWAEIFKDKLPNILINHPFYKMDDVRKEYVK